MNYVQTFLFSGWESTPFFCETFLRMNRAEAVPLDAFHTRELKQFENGMALEVIDEKNPTLNGIVKPKPREMVHEIERLISDCRKC